MSGEPAGRVNVVLKKALGRTSRGAGSLEKMNESTPLHRLGNVEDLGRLTVYLSTRDCYATNAIFHVDGGIDSNNSPLPIPDY